MFGLREGTVMDFQVYCDSILMPFLDMVVDLYEKNEVSYANALRLGSAMCDIEQCLYDKELHGIQMDVVFNILENFVERLNGI